VKKTVRRAPHGATTARNSDAPECSSQVGNSFCYQKHNQAEVRKCLSAVQQKSDCKLF